MTFDEALEGYRQLRTELRELQSEIDKAVREHEKLGKKIERDKKTYRAKRMALIDAQNALIPELQKEVNNSPTYEPPEIKTYQSEEQDQDDGSQNGALRSAEV
jgi:seryl-tRNA synthetase